LTHNKCYQKSIVAAEIILPRKEQEVVDVLRQVRGSLLVQRMELGELWQDTGFAFTKPDCTPFDPEKVTKAFSQTPKSAGLKRSGSTTRVTPMRRLC